jgi:hypothetical protein
MPSPPVPPTVRMIVPLWLRTDSIFAQKLPERRGSAWRLGENIGKSRVSDVGSRDPLRIKNVSYMNQKMRELAPDQSFGVSLCRTNWMEIPRFFSCDIHNS